MVSSLNVGRCTLDVARWLSIFLTGIRSLILRASDGRKDEEEEKKTSSLQRPTFNVPRKKRQTLTRSPMNSLGGSRNVGHRPRSMANLSFALQASSRFTCSSAFEPRKRPGLNVFFWPWQLLATLLNLL